MKSAYCCFHMQDQCASCTVAYEVFPTKPSAGSPGNTSVATVQGVHRDCIWKQQSSEQPSQTYNLVSRLSTCTFTEEFVVCRSDWLYGRGRLLGSQEGMQILACPNFILTMFRHVIAPALQRRHQVVLISWQCLIRVHLHSSACHRRDVLMCIGHTHGYRENDSMAS